MADLRAERKRNLECRQCGEPAKIDSDTGEVLAMCADHLAEDRARKNRAASKARKAKRGA